MLSDVIRDPLDIPTGYSFRTRYVQYTYARLHSGMKLCSPEVQIKMNFVASLTDVLYITHKLVLFGSPAVSFCGMDEDMVWVTAVRSKGQ